MAMLETPSRILRRIEALEAQDSDLPSLPSFPSFDDSGAQSLRASSAHSSSSKNVQMGDDRAFVPYQSTPPPASSHTTRSTMRPPSTSSSATRFANSMHTSMSTARRSQQESFEVSEILPVRDGDDSSSSTSIPSIHLPPDERDTEDLSRGQDQEAQVSVQSNQSDAMRAFPSTKSIVQDESRSTPKLLEEPQDSLPEATLSSKEDPQSSSESVRARTPFPRAFSSPAPSHLSTPTPAFAPLASHQPMATPMPQAPSAVADDLATPYNRRRSFLLSLVHSTTRPRMTFPTPHPRGRAVSSPRPRQHPLSQAWTPSDTHITQNARSNPSSSSSHSPHDRLSFISTASSHDLTVHPRANASFDPVMGAKGVGRFNAVKLNTYLHGLNRRLQEENETLVARLKMHGEEFELAKMAEGLERDGFRDIEEAVLGEVEAMRDELEKRELEKDVMKAETDALVESLQKERDEVRAELDTEREERKKDKERWKERMAEVETGIEKVIKGLETRLEDAERDAKSKIKAEERAHKFEERCAVAEEELDLAKRRAEKAEDALANASDLGAEVKRAYEHAAASEEEVRIAKERADQLESRLRDVDHKQEQLRTSFEDRLAGLDAELRESLEAQQSAEAHALESEAELCGLRERLDELEEKLATHHQQATELMAENEDIRTKLERQEGEATRAAQTAQQMEDALEESERKMIADEEELTSLRTKAIRLERELQALRERSKDAASLDQDINLSREQIISEADMEQLEAELDKAYREIGRLNHILAESPSRKAIDKAKDLRIELLEKEKDELTERVRELTSTVLAPSPNKTVSASRTPRPPHRQVLNCRTLKSPGTPLKDYSWLQDKTILPSTNHLVAQIEHLQQELHLANNSIDKKVDKLEEAGMGIVGLTEKLEDARTQITALEEEVRRLTRREDRRMRKLETARCTKCGERMDPSKPISTLNGEQREGVLTQLQKAQSDMDEVRTQLEKVKSDNHLLEAKLRAMTTVDQKAHLLEAKVSENQDIIEQLRDERELLAADQAALQRRYAETSAQVDRLRWELITSQSSHDERRHQLDMRVNEIEKLRDELTDQAQELERIVLEKNKARADRSGVIRTVESLESDLRRVRCDAELLGSDLKELKTERDRSETRHRDELSRADRVQKQLSTQVRLANEQLEIQRQKTKQALANLDGHVCQPNGEELEDVRMQHRNECKGLMVQIRYLQAKFTRESVFRADLGYQKHYLLGIMSSFEKSERQILAAIAHIGYPISQNEPGRKRPRLRATVAAVLFIAKARRASENWREQSASRSAVIAALQDVRRRRIAGSLGYT